MENKTNYALAYASIMGVGIIFGLVSFANAQFGGAQGQPTMPPGGEMKEFTPSKESISACDDKSEKDNCSFTPSNGSTEISGTCMKNPKDEDSLACMPKPRGDRMGGQNGNMAGGGFGGEMKKNSFSTESISACSSKSEKDSCSFTPSDGSAEISGTCMKNPQNKSELGCMPESKDNKNNSESIESRAEREKEMKKEQISQMENRVQKVIDFLDSKDIDTDDIKSNSDTFKDKADVLLSAYDTFIQALKDNNDDMSVNAVSNAFSDVQSLSKSLADYFRTTLRQSISDALAKLD